MYTDRRRPQIEIGIQAGYGYFAWSRKWGDPSPIYKTQTTHAWRIVYVDRLPSEHLGFTGQRRSGDWHIVLWQRLPCLVIARERTDEAGLTSYGMVTALWLATVVAVIVATYIELRRVLPARRMRRREDAGLCVNCGYDVRGSGGRCPECGAPAPSNRAMPRTLENRTGYPHEGR